MLVRPKSYSVLADSSPVFSTWLQFAVGGRWCERARSSQTHVTVQKALYEHFRNLPNLEAWLPNSQELPIPKWAPETRRMVLQLSGNPYRHLCIPNTRDLDQPDPDPWSFDGLPGSKTKGWHSVLSEACEKIEKRPPPGTPESLKHTAKPHNSLKPKHPKSLILFAKAYKPCNKMCRLVFHEISPGALNPGLKPWQGMVARTPGMVWLTWESQYSLRTILL